MLVPLLIERKRDGGSLSPPEWADLIAAYSGGLVPDYQMAALLMAVYWRGLDEAELDALTDAMLGSGDRLSLDTAQISQNIVLSVENIGSTDQRFIATLVGTAVD